MERIQVLRQLLNRLEHELLNYHVDVGTLSARVMDARAKTGNESADAELKKQADLASNTITMLTRVIAVREQMIAETRAELDPLVAQENAAGAAMFAATADQIAAIKAEMVATQQMRAEAGPTGGNPVPPSAAASTSKAA